jgi:hypothetical protein
VIVWSHLFNGKKEIGKAMQDGFFAILNQAPISKTSRTKIQKDMSDLNPKARKVAFNGACAIEVVDFLRLCHFRATFDPIQVQ